jgi:hypothetical protein
VLRSTKHLPEQQDGENVFEQSVTTAEAALQVGVLSGRVAERVFGVRKVAKKTMATTGLRIVLVDVV